MKMNAFADAGKTNPIKANFKLFAGDVILTTEY
jgi:hypothetical protein